MNLSKTKKLNSIAVYSITMEIINKVLSRLTGLENIKVALSKLNLFSFCMYDFSINVERDCERDYDFKSNFSFEQNVTSINQFLYHQTNNMMRNIKACKLPSM